MDSAQLWPLIPPGAASLADLGSGAGFPGMVLALLGFPKVTLVERDVRKAAFLRTVAAETGTPVELLNVDAGKMEGRNFDVLTSRALASLADLFDLSTALRAPHTVSLFLKGKSLDAELGEAQKEWSFAARRMPSATDEESFVVRITEVKSKG
jgi:16S rRNA (guanine527-N7)-methyltransferase